MAMCSDATLALPTGLDRSLRDRIGSFFAAIRNNHVARRDRARLSQMSDQMLNDVGLTRGDVRQIRRTPYFYL
jgi:uncharacterized protein YjiS (DUF1127 family)